ncbi:MAG: exo-alpha-sialidase [Candidatus Dormibacteraeota bacterium]|nr:exo-alpha-sialidase [Candidatus Dormibacteraeota bacterium]
MIRPGGRVRRFAFGIAGCAMVAVGLGTLGGPVHARAGGTCTPGSPEANLSENGFICPVEVGQSGGLGEPTIIHDDGAGNGTSNTPRLFVTAPQAIGNVNSSGGSPLFTSLDGGLTWGAPVRSQECTGLSGGDTDLAVDGNDSVFQTDLWLGNSCLSASDDHGQSFCAGNPYGTQPVPGDDRPWLALDKASSNLYASYDGETAIYLTNTAPTNTVPAGTCPATAIQTIGQMAVVPEVAVSSSTSTPGVRQCVCPPGGDAVDNSSGGPHSHTHRVFVSYSYQGGTEVSYMDPTCNAGGCFQSTWTQGAEIGDSTGASAFEDEWNFSPIKVDSNGTVYVMWAHALNWDNTNRLAGAGGVQEYYAYSHDGGATWSAPILLSTEDGSNGLAGTTTFPTMDVVGPGVIDAAWYGTSATGDPNAVPSNAQWNVYYTRVSNADSATPTTTGPELAVEDMHNGCIQTGGGASCSDRSLLDFFTLIDDPGSPYIIYTDGDVTNGVNLFFTKLASPAVGTPEVPWTGMLLLPGLAALGLTFTRRYRGSASPTL